MSYLFALDPLTDANAEERARLNPSGPAPAPWLTGQTLFSPFTGFAAGAQAIGGVAQTAILSEAEQNEAAGMTPGINAERFVAESRAALNRAAVERADVSPYTYGRAGEMVHGLSRFLTETMAGAAVGGPAGGAAVAGGTEGLDAFRRALAAGQDEQTAMLTAGITGVAAAGGAVIPLTGRTLGESALRGAVLMPEMGAFERGATGAVLDAAGYHDMAKQYQMLDGGALLTDAALGAAFGGFGHALHSRFAPMADRIPTLTDAALVDAKARAVEGAGPGIPADVATRSAHVEAMVKAEADLLAGRPVDVSERVDPNAMRFVEDPGRDAYDEAWRGAVNDEYGPQLADAQRMQDEAAGGALTTEAAAQTTPTLDAIKGEIGWAERGGKLIREGADADALARGDLTAHTGDVVGRTQWIPISDFWPERPDKSLSERDAHAAIDKALNGEPLRAKESRFVEYARRTLAERGAVDEAARLETATERSAIQTEGEPSIADPDLIAAGYLKLAPEERIAVERWLAYAHELEAQRGEIDRLAAEHRAAVPGGHGEPVARGPQPSARNNLEGVPGAGREAGGQGNAAQAQGEGLNRAREILAEHPDLHVVDENGQAVALRDLLARSQIEGQADAETANLIQVAVECALRTAA